MESKDTSLTDSTKMDASNDHPEVTPHPKDNPPPVLLPELEKPQHQAIADSVTPVPVPGPNTPQATPINITSSSSSSNSCTNSFFSLMNRHTVVDCYPSLPTLKRKMYGLPSMVKRLSLENRLKEHQGCVNCINFSWAGNLLASGSDDLQVVLWDWASGKVLRKFDSGHVANVFQVKKLVRYEQTL
jgi:WD40 repeat protein